MSKQNDISDAELCRALELVGQVWESDKPLSADDMCNHMDGIMAMMDDDADFGVFVESADLVGLERLN